MAQRDNQGKTSAQSSCHGWLREYRQTLEQDHRVYQSREIHWSWRRLGTFSACVAVAIVLRHNLLLAGLAVLVFLALFVYAVLRHTDWQNKRRFAEYLLTVVKESLHQSTEQGSPVRSWQRPGNPADPSMDLAPIFPSGPSWDLTEQERDDLDMYAAPVGIFGLLNRCSTEPGARRLRDMLETPLLSPDNIKQRQQMVQWLATHHEERLTIMASALPLRRLSDRLDQLVSLLKDTEANPHRRISLAIRIWSLFSGPLIAYGMLQLLLFNLTWLRPLALCLVINGSIRLVFGAMFRFCWESMAPYANLVCALRCLLIHTKRAGQELPDETSLAELKECFGTVVTHARILPVCQWLDMAKVGAIVRRPLNLVLFYDLHVAEAVLNRIVPQRQNLLHGLAALAELETFNSMACFAAEQPIVSYPELGTDPLLDIKAGRHPLVSEKENVPNDVHLSLEQKTWVVTGPNAAGKSTFLRMVGVHCLLAQIGSAVPAEGMCLSPLRLMTDVRVRDDLAKHESYFLSEVRRLRRIVMDTVDSPTILGLIDEPFQGTNFQERKATGIALLEHLMASNHFFLMATHQESLAQSAATCKTAANYHFQEELIETGIQFNYRLQPGPATTKTAIRILEQEGYPTSFLERARRLMLLD